MRVRSSTSGPSRCWRAAIFAPRARRRRVSAEIVTSRSNRPESLARRSRALELQRARRGSLVPPPHVVHVLAHRLQLARALRLVHLASTSAPTCASSARRSSNRSASGVQRAASLAERRANARSPRAPSRPRCASDTRKSRSAWSSSARDAATRADEALSRRAESRVSETARAIPRRSRVSAASDLPARSKRRGAQRASSEAQRPF